MARKHDIIKGKEYERQASLVRNHNKIECRTISVSVSVFSVFSVSLSVCLSLQIQRLYLQGKSRKTRYPIVRQLTGKKEISLANEARNLKVDTRFHYNPHNANNNFRSEGKRSNRGQEHHQNRLFGDISSERRAKKYFLKQHLFEFNFIYESSLV